MDATMAACLGILCQFPAIETLVKKGVLVKRGTHMAYLGSKSAVKKLLQRFMNHTSLDGWEYGELFGGFGHSFGVVNKKSLYHMSDLSPKLVRLYKAVQQTAIDGGW